MATSRERDRKQGLMELQVLSESFSLISQKHANPHCVSVGCKWVAQRILNNTEYRVPVLRSSYPCCRRRQLTVTFPSEQQFLALCHER